MNKSIRTGEIKLGDIKLTVHVLDNGRRVIEENSFLLFMEALGNGKLTQEQADKFAKDLNNV